MLMAAATHGFRTCVLSACVLTLALIVPSISAQTSAANAMHQAARDSISVNTVAVNSAAAIAGWEKADTGRMMPGYRDLSRYDTPGYCWAAMYGMERLLWRHGESDTLPKGTVSDTIPTAVRDIGRTCVAKMTPQNVDSSELRNLTRIALRIGDTALARQAILTHIAKITTGTKAQGEEVVDAIRVAISESRPIPFTFLKSLPSLIVKMGPEAPAGIAFALLKNVADMRFDTVVSDRISIEMETLERSMGRKGGFIFMDSMSIAARQRDPQLPATWRRLGDQFLARQDEGVDRVMWAGNIESGIKIANLLGAPAPALTMFRRYPENALLTPEIGKVTLIAGIPGLGAGRMEAYLALLRRMYERYHDQGLEIVLVGRTQGFTWASPPLEAGAEADVIGWYYRDYLKLPFPVLVEESTFGQLRDGRRVRAHSSFSLTFDDRIRVGTGYLVARDGTVISLNMQLKYDPQLEGLIRRELARSTERK